MNQFDPRYMQLLISKLKNINLGRQTVVSVAQELSVSIQTIHKHLLRYKRFGEDGIRRIQTRKRSGPAHNRVPEALEQCIIQLAREYTADGMDTKYPFGYKQGKVIYTIIDDASRWAFVWSYTTANAINTIDFVKKVIERGPFNIQKIRTDQGTEFANLKLNALLKEYDIIHRLNTP